MLQAWDAPLARPTMDIDMLGRVSNTVENLEQIVRACATVEVDADGVEWFGDATPNISITVYANPSCDPYQEQNCWNSGGSWDSSTCQCYGGGGGCNGMLICNDY